MFNPAWIFLAAIGAAIFHVVRTHRRAMQRIDRMVEAADDLGLAYRGRLELAADMEGLPFMRHGHEHRFTNCIEGETGTTRVRIFDRTCLIGHGKSRQMQCQSMVEFTSSELDLPDFALRPESLIDRAAGLFGMHDIDLEAYPLFSRDVCLTGGLVPEVKELVGNDDLVELLRSKPGIWIEGSGARLVVYRFGETVPPERIRTFFEEGFALFTALAARSRALAERRSAQAMATH